MTVAGEDGVVIAVTAGLADSAVHVPVPVAAMVAVVYWQMVRSVPAFGLAMTVTRAVSLHPLFDQNKV